MDSYTEIISYLKSLRNEENIKGMARFGINPENTLGVSIPVLRSLAKSFKNQHELALKLWDSGIHEVRILASMVDDHRKLTGRQMEKWAFEFDSWDVCDQVCMNLFEKSPLAWEKAVEWHKRQEEFIKRAGFVLMARLAFTDKKSPDERFYPFLEYIQTESEDSRNMVKKAVNWALRQIGKRNYELNLKAVAMCEKIKSKNSSSARWIANDALRELTDVKILERLVK